MIDRIARLREFLAANPADSFVQHALALEYLKVGKDVEARTLFEDILTRDPDYIGSYYHLGKVLEKNGETEMALRWYEKGMSKARQLGDQHSYQELQAAYDDLI